MLIHGSKPKPLPVPITGHEFWLQSPETDGRKERDVYMRHWLYCDYEKFLEYLETREKELGINHNQ